MVKGAKEKEKLTTIQVTKKVANELIKLKQVGDTYSNVILKLIKKSELHE